MQITRATEYAVRCALHLALQEPGRVVPRAEIARAMGIPSAFLAKIAQRLSRAGILHIRQGARGGYELLVPPRRLTLLAVVEAAEGEISLNKCVVHPRVCSRAPACPVHRVWERARRGLRETLGAVSFAELAGAERAVAARRSARCATGRPGRTSARTSALTPERTPGRTPDRTTERTSGRKAERR